MNIKYVTFIYVKFSKNTYFQTFRCKSMDICEDFKETFFERYMFDSSFSSISPVTGITSVWPDVDIILSVLNKVNLPKIGRLKGCFECKMAFLCFP